MSRTCRDCRKLKKELERALIVIHRWHNTAWPPVDSTSPDFQGHQEAEEHWEKVYKQSSEVKPIVDAIAGVK